MFDREGLPRVDGAACVTLHKFLPGEQDLAKLARKLGHLTVELDMSLEGHFLVYDV